MTIQELIDELNQLENKDQAVIFDYFIAHNFGADIENFRKVAMSLEYRLLTGSKDNYDAIAEALAEHEEE